MRQMPEESRNFRTVDKTWRELMAACQADTHILIATEYPNQLEILQNCNRVLEEIQKGLNDYLEKKRLFFPRYMLIMCIQHLLMVENSVNLYKFNWYI